MFRQISLLVLESLMWDKMMQVQKENKKKTLTTSECVEALCAAVIPEYSQVCVGVFA